MVQVTVLAVAPAQIALIRVGLAAKSLAAGALDVSCSNGRCETGSVGFEGVNQIADSEMWFKGCGLKGTLPFFRLIVGRSCGR